ncbi:MAG: tRNA (adenosine(37)-N6)-threonylcarbamoyltransferase complex ATPase subunit type 1 TsaE [bacterium]
MEIITHSPEETRKLGEEIGKRLERGDIISLSGELGTGKTCFAQGIGRGLGITEGIRSPTFIIINEYQGRLPLYHIDLYRLEGSSRIYELGYEEYLYGEGVCVIEWGEKINELLPPEHLSVNFTWMNDTQRQIQFFSSGKRFQGLLPQISLPPMAVG